MHEDEAGPPTQEDDWWHHEHVRAAGYPKVKRDRPMAGQMTISEVSDGDEYHVSFLAGGTCRCGARHNQEEADALNA